MNEFISFIFIRCDQDYFYLLRNRTEQNRTRKEKKIIISSIVRSDGQYYSSLMKSSVNHFHWWVSIKKIIIDAQRTCFVLLEKSINILVFFVVFFWIFQLLLVRVAFSCCYPFEESKQIRESIHFLSSLLFSRAHAIKNTLENEKEKTSRVCLVSSLSLSYFAKALHIDYSSPCCLFDSWIQSSLSFKWSIMLKISNELKVLIKSISTKENFS